MKTKMIFLPATIMLIFAGCKSFNNESANHCADAEMARILQARADSIAYEVTNDYDFASVARIMVVDTNKCVVVNTLRTSYLWSSPTSNEHFSFEPARLFLPLLLASIPELDTAMLLPVGRLKIGEDSEEWIVDSRRIFDSTGASIDSMTLRQVLAYGSNVAMAWLGEKYFPNRNALLVKIQNMLPETEITEELSVPKGFRRFCVGYGLKVDMETLLQSYLLEDVSRWLSLSGGVMNTRLDSGINRVTALCVKRCGPYLGLIVLEDCNTDGNFAARTLDSLFAVL